MYVDLQEELFIYLCFLEYYSVSLKVDDFIPDRY